jgi:predicted  nucleic acid-binding Zn-ribbon protein
MDPLDELESRIDTLIKQLTEKKAEIAGLRKQKSDSKLSDSKKKELAVKFGQDVNKAEKEFTELMKGIEEQFPVESDSESDSDSVRNTT